MMYHQFLYHTKLVMFSKQFYIRVINNPICGPLLVPIVWAGAPTGSREVNGIATHTTQQ
jgi:hypothetical protein